MTLTSPCGLAAVQQHGAGNLLRIVLVVLLIGATLMAWFLLRGYRGAGLEDGGQDGGDQGGGGSPVRGGDGDGPGGTDRCPGGTDGDAAPRGADSGPVGPGETAHGGRRGPARSPKGGR